MNSPTINLLFQRLSPVFIVAAVAGGAFCVYQNLKPPAAGTLPKTPAGAIGSLSWPRLDAAALRFDGLTFKKQTGEQPAANLGPLARRFRLAGTFMAATSYQQSRKAIIDDLQKKSQCLVAENDTLDPNILVVSISRDRVVLRDVSPGSAESRDEQLWLSFSGGGKPASMGGSQEMAMAQSQVDATLSRFGKRTGERRWVLQRAEVVRYYQELLNNPDRLAKVFESLKPVYKTGKIAGYTLDIEAEGDVFQAFGLKQGDIIRQVNSMPMISQTRAEYFINEFVKNRANAFVLDIERDTKPEKLIYMIR